MISGHIPVLLKEVIDLLHCRRGGIYVDCTVGEGGHAEAILERIGPEGKLIAIDRDGEAMEVAKKRLANFPGEVIYVQDNFCNLKNIVFNYGIDKVDGLLFDLGPSWLQLSTAQRGFSFKLDGPLDMRMDLREEVRAYDLVNSLGEEELAEIISRYGEERWAKRIACLIVKNSKANPIATTAELASIATRAIPARFRPRRIHPATRTFQALRIAVNRELEALEQGLLVGIELLKPRGRICVISFHSLEDRLVKHTFQKLAGLSCSSLKSDSCASLQIITKKPIRPSEGERKDNPRSRSAKLRVAEKL